MPNPIDFALSMIKKNPAISNNPNFKEYINILERGDSQKGEELANNLLNSYGVFKDEALQQAKSFFHIS